MGGMTENGDPDKRRMHGLVDPVDYVNNIKPGDGYVLERQNKDGFCGMLAEEGAYKACSLGEAIKWKGWTVVACTAQKLARWYTKLWKTTLEKFDAPKRWFPPRGGGGGFGCVA